MKRKIKANEMVSIYLFKELVCIYNSVKYVEEIEEFFIVKHKIGYAELFAKRYYQYDIDRDVKLFGKENKNDR